MNLDQFYKAVWSDYIKITPQAEAIRKLFLKIDANVVNDHVAFRTFSDCSVNLAFLSSVIVALGYEVQDHYDFELKKLKATSFIHTDPDVPKIFVSELERHRLSAPTQDILNSYCSQISSVSDSPEVFWSGRHWNTPSYEDYKTVLAESEYAAWLLVIGLRANHFTVSVNHLESTNSIVDVLQRVENSGFAINESGGRVKGTPESLLEQGSTMADKQGFIFAEGEKHEVPTCFYEFAMRHKDADGNLYQGFIAANADKIFESTSTS